MNKYPILLILVFLVVFGSCYTAFSQDDAYVSSLKRELKHAEGKHRIDVSNNLCRYYMYSEPDIALYYAHLSLNEAYKNSFINEKITAYNLLGIVYNSENHFDSSFINFNKSIKIAYFLRDTVQIASILNNIGFINFRLCNYQEALTNFYQSLNYYEHINDKSQIGSSYNNIGLIYNELKEYDKALKFYRMALQLGKSEKKASLLGPSMTNIGFVYSRRGESRKALLYLDSALVYCKKYKDKYNEAKIYKEIGIIYLTNKAYNRALEFLKISENENKKLKNSIELASVYERQSECFMAMNQLDKAMELANKSLKYSSVVVYKKYLVRAYKNISKIYEKKHDFQRALLYYRKSIETNDEILDQQKISIIYNMQLQQETDKNANQIAELNRQKQIQSLVISKQNWQITGLVILFLLTIIILYVIYKNKKHKQEIKLESAIHNLKEQRAREVLEAENRERKRIGEELHESLSQILLLAKLTVSSLKIKDHYLTIKQKEIVGNSINLLNTAFDELRNISHNLTPFLLKEKGLVECIEDMLHKIGKTNHWIVNFEDIGFDERLNNFLETTLYRVVQEITNNIIRHAEASEINCQMIKTEKELTIMMEDNGKGFDVNKLKTADGIGIHNIYSRVENLNGTVLIDSALGRGTIFTIIIPLNT